MDWLDIDSRALDRIWRTARGVIADDDAAWDCVQEALATALATPTRPDSPVAWLCGVARNHARTWGRTDSRYRKAVARMPKRTESEPASEDLREALGRLPIEQRDAVSLRYLAGMTIREVAEAQSVSESAAKSRVRRGLRQLRATLGAPALCMLLLDEAKAAQASGALRLDPSRHAAASAGAGARGLGWVVAVLGLLVAGGGVWLVNSGTQRQDDETRVVRDPEPSAPPLGAGNTTPEQPAKPEVNTPARPVYPADRPGTVLRGVVVDELHRPLEGVPVRVRAHAGGVLPDLAVPDDRGTDVRMTTDHRGRFKLALPSGPYRLIAGRDDRHVERQVAVTGRRRDVRLVLTGAPGAPASQVTVVDSAGQPVAGASVEVVAGQLHAGIIRRTGETGADGVCQFRDAPWWRAMARVRTRDGRSGSATERWIPPLRDTLRDLRVVVDRPGSLHGRLLGLPAEQLTGARVSAHRLTAGSSPYGGAVGTESGVPVEGGAYRLEELPAGPYVLTLHAPSGARIVGRQMRGVENSLAPVLAEVEAGHGTRRDLRVEPGAILRGRVTRAGGDPVAGALVKVAYGPGTWWDGLVLHGVTVWRLDSKLETSSDHPTTHWRVRTGKDGRYVVPGLLPDGHVRVEVFAEGLCFDRRETVAVKAGGPTELEHELVPAGVLQMAVSWWSYLGLIPVGAESPTLIANVSWREAVTFPGLRPGRYRAVVYHGDPAKGIVAELGETRIDAGKTTWWDLFGEGKYVLRGHVLARGRPVSDVRVRASNFPPARTDSTGAYELRSPTRFATRAVGLQADGLTWNVAAPDFVPPESAVPQEIHLGQHEAEIRVSGPRGEPLARRVWISCRSRRARLVDSAVGSGPDGILLLKNLYPGSYTAELVEDWGATLASVEFTVPAAKPVTLTEPPVGSLAVEVKGRWRGERQLQLYVWNGEGDPPDDHEAFVRSSRTFIAVIRTPRTVRWERVPAGQVRVQMEGPELPTGWKPPAVHRVTIRAGAWARCQVTAR